MRRAFAALSLAGAVFAAFEAGGFEPREDAAFERGYYVPSDLDDAIRELDRALSNEEKQTLRRRTLEEMLLQQRSNLGVWIRNNWLFGDVSRLRDFFEGHGVVEIRAMSILLLEAYWIHLRGQEIRLDERIESRRKRAARAAPPDDTRCPDRPGEQLESLFRNHTIYPTGQEQWVHFYRCPSTGTHWVFERGWAPASAAQRKEVEDSLERESKRSPKAGGVAESEVSEP